MCTATLELSANASASGVDREPGATKASLTPDRTHSSTNVAQNVAAEVTGTCSPTDVTATFCTEFRQTGQVDATNPPLYSTVLHSNPSGRSITLAHGFTQNVRCWGAFPDQLAERVPEAQITAVDLPGHGSSGHDDVGLEAAGQLLAQTLAPRTTVIGYSMGGRIALHSALASPATIDRLILIGATAGIDDESDRRERRAADAKLAMRLVEDGLPAFLDRWLAAPLFASLPPEAAAVEGRLTNRADGLAATLRNRGTGSQSPLWDRLPELAIPVLVIAGEHDDKFVALGERMTAGIGDNATMTVIKDSGHAAHLEQPATTAAAIKGWLSD